MPARKAQASKAITSRASRPPVTGPRLSKAKATAKLVEVQDDGSDEGEDIEKLEQPSSSHNSSFEAVFQNLKVKQERAAAASTKAFEREARTKVEALKVAAETALMERKERSDRMFAYVKTICAEPSEAEEAEVDAMVNLDLGEQIITLTDILEELERPNGVSESIAKGQADLGQRPIHLHRTAKRIQGDAKTIYKNELDLLKAANNAAVFVERFREAIEIGLA